MTKIVLFHGSVRKKQQSEYVSKFIAKYISGIDDVSVKIIDPRDYNVDILYEGDKDSSKELTKIVDEADAYIIVAPEYNHSFTGGLKMLLDMNLKEYIHKPVSLVGVSSGPFGGTRVIESLVNVVRELGLIVTFSDLNVSDVREEFGGGKPKDLGKWTRRLDRVVEELLWMSNALKYGRENLPSKYHNNS